MSNQNQINKVSKILLYRRMEYVVSHKILNFKYYYFIVSGNKQSKKVVYCSSQLECWTENVL